MVRFTDQLKQTVMLRLVLLLIASEAVDIVIETAGVAIATSDDDNGTANATPTPTDAVLSLLVCMLL